MGAGFESLVLVAGAEIVSGVVAPAAEALGMMVVAADSIVGAVVMGYSLGWGALVADGEYHSARRA